MKQEAATRAASEPECAVAVQQSSLCRYPEGEGFYGFRRRLLRLSLPLHVQAPPLVPKRVRSGWDVVGIGVPRKSN